MNRELVFTENEINNNPLVRKMRERFICSGNMTIGEIMLHRAERDTRNTSTPATFMAPTAKQEPTPVTVVAAAQPAKAIDAPMRSSRRTLILSCVAIALCTVVLLAFILPVITNFDANAVAEIDNNNVDIINTSASDTTVPAEEETTGYSFNNVMHTFSRTFGG